MKSLCLGLLFRINNFSIKSFNQFYEFEKNVNQSIAKLFDY